MPLFVVGDYINPHSTEYDSFVCEIINAKDSDLAWWKGKCFMAEYGRNIEWLMEIKDMKDCEHWIKRMEEQNHDINT
jgi:hypothetical protein